MTDEEFILRLIEADWTREDAETSLLLDYIEATEEDGMD